MLIKVSVAIDLFGAVISLIIFCFLLMGNNRKVRLNRLFAVVVACTIAILLLDAISWTFDGTTTPYSALITKIVSFLGYVFMYLVIGAFTIYIEAYFKTKQIISNSLVRFALGLCGIAVFTVIISQFGGRYYYMDETNLYHRGNLYWLSQVLVFAGLFVNIIYIFTNRKALTGKERISFLSYLTLPMVLNVFHIWVYEMSWSCVALTLAVVVIYAGIQSDQAKRLAEQELALSEKRTAIMLSQIRPHFIYNVLNTIGDMCVTDPELAEETVLEFADYLRMNMDSLSSPELVAFDKELRHVRTYLALEEKRFEDRLCVVYDIKVRDFYLPPLTVQPLVENAVLHGITVRQSMGTLTVRTERADKGVVIRIVDDGVGFAFATLKDSDKTHIGIDNVRNRLAMLCGGTLSIDSTVGKGTTVTIFIPQEVDA